MHTLDLLDQQTSSSNQNWRPQSFLWSPKRYQAYCQPDNRKKKKPLRKKLWSCPKSKRFKTGSSSRICIVEKKRQIVSPLYSVFFDAQSEVESSMTDLLKHFCWQVRLLQLRFSTLYTINIIELFFTTSTYWHESSISLLIFLYHSSVSLISVSQTWGSK